MIPRGHAGKKPPRHAREGGTRERILDTAERLFAERGIDGVSVRAILAEAGVNVALAHRHFGGRDGLIDELLRRAIGPLNERRMLLLEAVEARGDAATLEDVLRALFAPAVRWIFEHPDRARLLAHVQASPDPRIRALHRDQFRDLLARFGALLERTAPARLAPVDLVCRFFFVLGTGLVTSLQADQMSRTARERFGPAAVPGERDLVDQLVAFCAAGVRAPPQRRAERPCATRRERARRAARKGGEGGRTS